MNARLSSGGRIDRRRVVHFTFNGRTYQGFEGDTLASALLASGVSLVARSWKYHRPRGIVAPLTNSTGLPWRTKASPMRASTR